MPQHAPTEEQAEIIAAVERGDKSLMISAYAGTAKSTTLEMAAPKVVQPALALAFNKKIADELQVRLPGNFKARTLNSIGHAAWIRGQQLNSVSLDGRKLGKIVTTVAKDQRIPLTTYQWEEIRDGVSAAMRAGLSPGDAGSPIIRDTKENWLELIDPLDGDDFEFMYDIAWESLRASIDLAKAGQMSFDDQIYCPTILGGAWEKYPRVFVDEAQDLSLLNHVMLDLCSMGPISAVGDKRQAIYLFRGADSNSMDSMRRLRPIWGDLNLTLTFRCPRVIVARQQEHAPGYRAAPANIDGCFIEFASFSDVGWSWDTLKSLMSDIVIDEQPARQLAILCRNNAPLVSLAFKLIKEGVGCMMLGRDIGRGLVLLTTKLAKDDKTPITKFRSVIDTWLDKECVVAMTADKPDRIAKLTDQVECLRATIAGSGPSTVGELRSVLQRVFSRENGQVVLSSIHRAKGLEWPLVVHLDPFRIPSKYALAAEAAGDSSHINQEYNLRYVAETRTKHTLINASMEDFQS
jgi:DNA helicase II / ATP-dependent DNA helicase PcrA